MSYSNVIYLKTFDDGFVYIGVTNNFNRRMREHNNDSKGKSNMRVHRHMRIHSHETEILAYFENYKDALNYEILIIENFKNLGFDVLNSTVGGEGIVGLIKTNEHRKNLSKSLKGRFGKIPNAETRAKMSASQKGRKISEEHKKILSDYGKTRTGEKNCNFGKPRTEETKINISIANQNRFDEDYYANKGVRRSDFKIACKVRGWSINDFEQIKSGEKCNDGKNKYFYVRKFSIKKLEKL